jgi:hypothetical protein
MLIKKSPKLFNGKHRYKIVLKNSEVLPLTLKRIINACKEGTKENAKRAYPLGVQLGQLLATVDDYSIRSTYDSTSIYVDDYKVIDAIAKIYTNDVIYVAVPARDGLAPGEVVSTKITHRYKVHFLVGTDPCPEFANWCKNNKNIRIGSGSLRLLEKGRKFYPLTGYFYVKNDSALTIAKLQIGKLIRKVETVISN